jgi:hypothetical protein
MPSVPTMQEPKPQQYEPPSVTDYGDLKRIVAGQVNGNFLDKDFPAGTPKTDLTFS